MNVPSQNLMKKRWAGALATILLSFIILWIFYGTVIRNINHTYFAKDGDGFKCYYGVQYHIKYDTSYYRMNGMNYPFGEMVAFTDCLPVFSNTLKFLASHGADFSEYSTGIINSSILFSVILASFFLFLLFSELGVSNAVAVPAAVLITYLSPQLERFGGHFSLSYLFAIPLMFYMILKFSKSPSWWLTMLISMIVFVASYTHFYYYAFFGIIILAFWIYAAFVLKGDYRKWWFAFSHITIQLIIPFVIIQLQYYLYDGITDRTSYPWGILFYRAYPESVLLPACKPYGRFIRSFMTFNHVDWEGWAYVGLVGAVTSLILLGKIIQSLFQRKKSWVYRVTDQPMLNVFFWASFAALLYSFGLPYICNMTFLLDYIGILRQMRGIARFSWLFFYIINIIAFYLIYKLHSQKKQKRTLILLISSLLMLTYDSYYEVRKASSLVNFKVKVWDDTNNTLPENQWVKKINPDRYQAIIPIPYFHIGSENVWINNCDPLFPVLIVSYKTGLPTTGVMLSRTSLSQSFGNIGLMSEPCTKNKILDMFRGDRDLLIVRKLCETLTESEKYLLSKAVFIDTTLGCSLYHLDFKVLQSMTDSFTKNIYNSYKTTKLYPHDSLMISDTAGVPYYFNDAHLVFDSPRKNNEVLSGKCLRSIHPGKTYYISFWIHGIHTDVMSRSLIILSLANPSGNIYEEIRMQTGYYFKAYDNDSALCEIPFRVTNPSDKLSLHIINQEILHARLHISNLMIRPAEQDVYREWPDRLMKNNRFYSKQK